jgi:hypothetical protein
MKKIVYLLLFVWHCFISYSQLSAAVSLLPHQSTPIAYLAKNPDIKGLLVYHSLGSGKTFLALSFAEKYPGKKVYILLPRFLKSNWKIQMDQYGVRTQERYITLSFEEASDQLVRGMLRDQIVIIDEVHKFVDYLRREGLEREKYVKLYFEVQSAWRILGLSGTPIYKNPTDISYILNLVSAKDLLPYSSQLFRQDHTKIVVPKSWIRGYLLESKWLATIAPTILLAASTLILPPGQVILGALGAMVALPTLRSTMPVSEYKLREFDPDSISALAAKYVSYYQVNFHEDENFPKKEVEFLPIPYSRGQIKFFLDFANSSLRPAQLALLVREHNPSMSNKEIQVAADSIQQQFALNPGAGTDIGNLPLENEEQPKFQAVLAKIQQSKGPVVIYSNYFVNGLKLLQDFLDRHGYQGQSKIIDPEFSLEQQIALINAYNQGKVKILLLHPEITEGISLLGTDQLHILEPIVSSAIQDQVIGRVVRFKSHAQLPKERQRVQVFIWYNEVNYGKWFQLGLTRDEFIRREHYLQNFGEINENLWGSAVFEVDVNYRRKERSPDQVVIDNLHHLDKDRDSFAALVSAHSIETTLGKER